MGAVDHRQRLFENIVRLRRAGRDMPGNRDISVVRAALEGELGATVSRRLAARVLGVSHTALERWIKAGDIPVVYSPAGRLEVPVPPLMDLYESVEADRANGHRRYALKPTMARQRDAARKLRFDHSGGAPRRGHDRARIRSLAYHEAVSKRLRTPMVQEARHVLGRWREQGRIDDRYAEVWDEILDRPVAEIRRVLADDSPESDDLRQNSPFAGMLSEPERQRILREIE